MVNGCISFNVASVNGFTGKRVSYQGQIDVFLVYCESTGLVYKIPATMTGKSAMRLRVAKNNGGATNNIKWAEDFIL